MSRNLNWAIVGLPLLLLIVVGFDLLMGLVLDPRGDEFGGFILGVTFAQITVLAVWTALGPAQPLVRIATGLVLAMLIALSLFGCLQRTGGGDAGIVLAGVVLALWFIVQLPLWVVRLSLGWRLSWPGEAPSHYGGDEVQFGVRQLLAWTALVAITLGIGRWLVPDDIQNMGRSPHESLAIFGVLAVFNALLPMPIVWAAFVRRRMPVWMSMAAMGYVLVTFAEVHVFKVAMGRGGDEEIFWIMNAVQFVGAGASLLLIRACGFRAVRVCRSSGSSSDA